MEIDALDDFDTRFQTTNIDLANWNGHDIKWLSDLGINSSLIHRVFHSIIGADKTKKDVWAGTQNLVNFYLGQKRAPQETIVKAAEYALTGRISLNDLIASDYLDREIQIVPFILSPDANLPLIELPEGLSWAFLTAPPIETFQYSVPGLRFFLEQDIWRMSDWFATNQVQEYLRWVSFNYGPIFSAAHTQSVESAMEVGKLATITATEAQTALIATTQATNPITAIGQAGVAGGAAQQAQSIATGAEQDWITFEAIAQTKRTIAKEEEAKAISATKRAIDASAPPYLGQPGYRTEPAEYTIEKWKNERASAAAAAEKQAKIAAAAAEDAKLAEVIALGKKQAAITATEQAQIAETSATQAQSCALASFQSVFLPIPSLNIPVAPTFSPTPHQLNLEDLLENGRVSQMVQQFVLTKTFTGSSTYFVDARNITIDPLQENSGIWAALETIGNAEPEFYDPIPAFAGSTQVLKLSFNQQLVQLIEEKLGEVGDPDYLDQFNRWHADNREFTTLLEKKLEEADQLPETIKNETLQRSYAEGMQLIEDFFKRNEPRLTIGSIDNYASKLSSNQPMGPFQAVPLLGFGDQCTIHYYSGIANNFASAVEGGLCLNKSLEYGFAVKPHLTHSDNLAQGLVFVALEKVNDITKDFPPIVGFSPSIPLSPKIVLAHSQIQESIQYEVDTLSVIAQNIIATGNPNLKQVHVPFSNAGYQFREALKLLPPEYRETIVVITVGTTAIIEDELACKVYNIIGDKDIASLLCNGGKSMIETAAKNGLSVQIIPQNETQPLIQGHYFMQPDYQDRISKIITKEIAKTYEIN